MSETTPVMYDGSLLDGRYESISPLNAGSFGVVFLARDHDTSELVAIKRLNRQPADSTQSMGESLFELHCHATLHGQPNIVNLLRSFETSQHTYLVLEYCPRGDLYEAIRQGHGPLETENVREFMHQLVGAVEYMHSKKLYHRDIKPENIFLMQDGSMKLGDLGLATQDEWSTEVSVGSDRYMAPEQFDPQEGGGYSPAKADCWAIGICLLNVLFSRNPFVTPTESDILFADFARDSKSLFDIFPSMSEDTFAILNHAMAIDPTKRSLDGIRRSLEKVVSFTTDDDALDDFCTTVPHISTALPNREPLRTPSITSPPTDTFAFPWAKALRASPAAQGRQLSTIDDTASFTEDLFAPSVANRRSWVSWAQNSSVTSGLDSMLESSVRSLALRNPPAGRPFPLAHTKPVAVPQSLPGRLANLNSIFGNSGVSKSWTDLYDEEEEEDLEELDVHEDILVEEQTLLEPKLVAGDLDGFQNPAQDLVGLPSSATSLPMEDSHLDDAPVRTSLDGAEDIFAFEDAKSSTSESSEKHSSLRVDKWSVLGNRRRQCSVGRSPGFGLSEATLLTKEPQPRMDSPQATPLRSPGVAASKLSARSALLMRDWRNGFGLKALSTTSTPSRPLPLSQAEQSANSKAKVLDWRRGMSPAPAKSPRSALASLDHANSKLIARKMKTELSSQFGWDIEWLGGLLGEGETARG